MEPLGTGQVQCYLFDTNTAQYADKGLVGIAVVGSAGSPGQYRLGCYLGDEYLCTADITNNNDTGIQWSIIGTGYASFRDDQSRIWSVSFPGGDSEAFRFTAAICVAMYGASNQPEGSVICCDVAQGKRERIVVPNDKVKVRYTSWVMKRGEPSGQVVPTLGSELESNEHDEAAYIYAAPLNHNNVTADMKGFEGMTIGMAEESRRFIIVPKSARRGAAPNVHVCYMVYVIKKKDNAASEVEAFRTMKHLEQHGTLPNSQQHMGAGGAAAGGQQGAQLVVPGGQQVPGQPNIIVVHAGGSSNNNNNNDSAGGNNNNSNKGALVLAEPAAPAPAAPLAPAAPAAAPVYNTAMPPPPPGFNFEQMDVVNRMRDQCANLLMQIKEATSRIDLFSHDMRQGLEKSKPKSLATAQMTHTLEHMLQETDSLKGTLEERDKTLRQLEERNKDLQGKVDAFTATAQRLSEEKKMAMAETSQVKLDGDQRSLSLQAELTRIMSEREDTMRHLSSVKRLLEISDADSKKEKQALQTAEVQLVTIEAKQASTNESLVEERSRRKLLESKITTLGDELRALLEEVRVKESQIDERRRKMEADKLHYSSIMDEERNRAAEEMRDLREELVQEITVRDRRYQEERARVARESFERGRVQGIEDGHNEAAMEVDARMQMLTLEAQRHRSEVETLKVRMHQSHETAEASRRHQESHCAALGRVVDELSSNTHALEVELRALESTRVTAQQAAAESITEAIVRLSRPVSRSDLLQVMHSLRIRAPIDTSFEGLREAETRRRLSNDHDAVVAWVKRRLVAPVRPGATLEPAPPLITPWAEDIVPEGLTKALRPGGSDAGRNDDALLGDGVMGRSLGDGPAMPQYLAEVEKRQKQLLAALHQKDPTLELVKPLKVKTPPRIKTPEPESEEEKEEPAKKIEAATKKPTPKPKQHKQTPQQQQQPVVDEKKSDRDNAHDDEKKSQNGDDDYGVDVDGGFGSGDGAAQSRFRDPAADAEAEAQKAAVEAAAKRKQQEEEEEEEEEQAEKARQEAEAAAASKSHKKRPPPPAPKVAIESEEEEEEEDWGDVVSSKRHKKGEKPLAGKKPAIIDDTPAAEDEEGEDDDAAEAEEVEEEAGYEDEEAAAGEAEEEEEEAEDAAADPEEEEEEKPKPAPAAKPPAAKPSARQAALFNNSDNEDSDADSKPAFRASTAAPKTAAAAKATAKLFNHSNKKGAAAADSDEDNDEASKPVFRVAPAAAAKPATKQPAAATAASAAPAAKPAARAGLFAETSSDDDEPAAKKAGRGKAAPAAPVAKKATAVAAPAKGKAPPPKRAGLFGGSDSD